MQNTTEIKYSKYGFVMEPAASKLFNSSIKEN